MGFFVVGLNHKLCPVEIREKLHFREDHLQSALRWASDHLDIEEIMILSTCNRVEFYGYHRGEEFPRREILKLIQHVHQLQDEDYAPFLYRYESKDMIRHLFRVAAGLDSLVVGENEILGQLRESFKAANAAGSVHSLIYRLMEKALKVGKSVRSETKINEGAVSIPSVAVELAEKIFGKLTGEKVMVLGSGEMSTLTLKNLRDSGASIKYIVSRNAEQGKTLAGEFGADWVSFEGWENYLGNVDILIASTSAPHPIVRGEQVKKVMRERKQRPLFLIDIAVPRNIEPQVESIDDVYLYNVDDLTGVSNANLKLRRKEIRAAEDLIEKAVMDYQAWLEQLKARPVMERFEAFLDEVLTNELGRLSDVPGMSASVREELKTRIRSKLLHPPFEKIKEASQNGGVNRYLEALHSLFNLKK
ncbi:MAG: glutamyl-tRNA reductase [Candidatus Omnitrophica bacterium]|nr:glutamyl-tRNA reductase [Candidatus Omnitrophota bacterium]